jgi:hypothetical protein
MGSSNAYVIIHEANSGDYIGYISLSGSALVTFTYIQLSTTTNTLFTMAGKFTGISSGDVVYAGYTNAVSTTKTYS